MEFLVVMESIYDVDTCKPPALLCSVANKLYGQQWFFEKDEESNTNDIETDYDREELSPLVKRRKKEIVYPNFCFTNKEVYLEKGF